VKVPAIGRLAYRLVLSGAHLMRMIEAGSTPAPSTSNLKYSNLMRKSEERLKIEALKPGKKVEFPASQYVKICRVVTTANTTARAKGYVKPEDLMYSIDGKAKRGKVLVVRNL